MKKLCLVTAILTLLAIGSIAQAAEIRVAAFGDNGWYSSETKNASGTVLIGKNYTHNGSISGTMANDIEIAKQIKFVDNGYSPSPTGMPNTMTGSENGALQLYATTANAGKAQLSRFNADGFGSTTDLLGSSFFANYRQFTIKDTTTRTPALSISVVGSDNLWYSLAYVDPAHASTFGVWTDSAINSTSGSFSLYGPSGSVGISKVLSAWASDSLYSPILFGSGAKVTQLGFNLGTYSRNAYTYIDYVESNIIDSGIRNNFGVPAAVPEPATILGFGIPMLMIGLGKLKSLRK